MRWLELFISSSFNLFHHIWEDLQESDRDRSILNSIEVIFISGGRLRNEFLALTDKFSGHECIDPVHWFKETSKYPLYLVLTIN